MEWEMQANSAILDTLIRMLPITDKIVAVGGSEGGMLAARFAASDDRITHLVSIVSTGLNQFYSSIINRRMDAAMGTMTHQEAQTAIDSLFAVYKKIYRHPNSTAKWYYGHPYRRWGSFANYIPLNDLVKLDIPILYVNGTLDRSSPILQADYIQLEFIRLGKENLTYVALPGVEHSLYEIVTENGEERGVSRRDQIFKMIKEWIAVN
jgi:pimeloyl-ACP methyl ester carboxylesterase